MAYNKINWTENTPITADRLNQMETGIANSIDKTAQVMEIPITNSSGWQQFRWTKPGATTISWTRDALAGKAVEIFNETTKKQLLLLTDSGNLTVNGNTVWHTGNFNPATKLDAGNFSISNRDLKIYGKRALVGHDTGEGNHLVINYDRDFGAGVKIYGLTRTDAIENGGKLTFFNQMGGGQMSSLINCQELQNNTGNGQMMTASGNRIYVGNPNTHLIIESGSNPTINVGGATYQLYHTGNKPTAADIGAMGISGPTFSGNLNQNGPGGKDWVYHINADRGTLNIAPKENGNPNWGKQIYFDRNGQMYCNGNRRVATINQENPAHHMIRYGAGMGGENGYITFSW